MKPTVKKQYRYACQCGCDETYYTFSKRKAVRDGKIDDPEVMWAISVGHTIVADCYTESTAKLIASAIKYAGVDKLLSSL